MPCNQCSNPSGCERVCRALRLAGAAGLVPDPDVVGAAIGKPASSEISDLTAAACSPLGPGEDEYLSWVRLMERQRLAAAGVKGLERG